MAKKPQSFKIVEKDGNKFIVIYTNVEQTEGEKSLIEYYLKNGYAPMTDTKKKGKTVKEMRAELESADADLLAKFNEAYKTKEKGFHEACKIYTAWKKNNK